ncbi:hypothetical protein LTR64_005176 [Lithohypha guttulata]|uniref:uncharacterized protein n=1 Tax=Lithohypha guttulata TaxID=1690604 RepID=UPI002DE136B7|nr:hypothetical protein LTR51_003031 [Lithohypha guttulata]
MSGIEVAVLAIAVVNAISAGLAVPTKLEKKLQRVLSSETPLGLQERSVLESYPVPILSSDNALRLSTEKYHSEAGFLRGYKAGKQDTNTASGQVSGWTSGSPDKDF